MTVAFKTLLALVNSIDVLVKSTLTKEQVAKVEGWIEPAEEVKTPDQTGVGTEAVENSNTHEGWYTVFVVDKDDNLYVVFSIFYNDCAVGKL